MTIKWNNASLSTSSTTTNDECPYGYGKCEGIIASDLCRKNRNVICIRPVAIGTDTTITR